ncbi:diguanylate cyclase domain-containing protein [Pseudomonas sp.]|uniref:diguanylate cyclase domain-containing protein n=1 Tax=Pseudomonas sp. TaxID=306 RepID=UPI00273552AD|nr:diguanylate cyclase [Pseudomonas sp.]MDP3813725.1 diguanylate cyclase [Pseudomonas sp.]
MNKQGQQLLVRALEAATNAILITDRSGHIVWLNEAFCRLSGYPRRELLGQTPHMLYSGKQSPSFYQDLWQTILAGQPWQGELVERRKDGSYYRVNQVITPLLDPSGAITHFIAIQHSLTVSDQEHAEMRRLAYHDGLTGLPNRILFLDLLHQAINHAAPTRQLFALMFLDLDRFKSINDSLGHACGDKLLIAVSERLGRAVRKSDVVARLSGDEFALLVTHLEHAEVVEALARQLVASLDRPFGIDEHAVQTHISIGISLYPRDGQSAEELLSRADAAMYQAKAAGGGAYRFCLVDQPCGALPSPPKG